MRNGKEILTEAVNSLYKYTSIETSIEDGRLRYVCRDDHEGIDRPQQDQRSCILGGEPAANKLTGYLHPGTFTIYTDQNWQSIKEIELVSDENGIVELLEMFWEKQSYNGVPPVLIYAYLMSSGSDRNIETAH